MPPEGTNRLALAKAAKRDAEAAHDRAVGAHHEAAAMHDHAAELFDVGHAPDQAREQRVKAQNERRAARYAAELD